MFRKFFMVTHVHSSLFYLINATLIPVGETNQV